MTDPLVQRLRTLMKTFAGPVPQTRAERILAFVQRVRDQNVGTPAAQDLEEFYFQPVEQYVAAIGAIRQALATPNLSPAETLQLIQLVLPHD